jgi:hypothetical protein
VKRSIVSLDGSDKLEPSVLNYNLSKVYLA